MPDRFTGFPADAYLMEQLEQAQMEINAKHNPFVEVYTYPLLENLFQNVYTFALTLDEENEHRKTFLKKIEKYASGNFAKTYHEASEIFYCVYEFLNGIGLFSHREKPQDKIEWTWQELRETERKIGR
jgi:hypothetical protein